VLIRAVARLGAALDGWGCCMAGDSIPAPVHCSVSKSKGRNLGGKEMTVGSRPSAARRGTAGPRVVMGRSGGAGLVG
jgi:hypothetical protein